MSRSGYSDDCDDNWALICWRGAVKSALRGRRGQAFLRELIDALDALPQPRLISHDLVVAPEYEVIGAAEYCALGAVGRQRRLALTEVDPYDRETVAGTFGIADAMAAEIMHENDEGGGYWNDTPEKRWARVRAWAVANLKKETEA